MWSIDAHAQRVSIYDTYEVLETETGVI